MSYCDETDTCCRQSPLAFRYGPVPSPAAQSSTAQVQFTASPSSFLCPLLLLLLLPYFFSFQTVYLGAGAGEDQVPAKD